MKDKWNRFKQWWWKRLTYIQRVTVYMLVYAVLQVSTILIIHHYFPGGNHGH